MFGIPHATALVVLFVVLVVTLGYRTRRLGALGGSSAPTEPASTAVDPSTDGGAVTTESGQLRVEGLYDELPARIEDKRGEYPRAPELREPTGFINTDGVRLSALLGEYVVLVEFWTFGCYNCQNTHPHIQEYWRTYSDEGLVVIGVHYPEFEREHDRSNVEAYINETETTYPVVLDNNGRTWEAYNQRYWPARYLIDIDGFVRHKHIGEGGYDETDQHIQELLAERKRILRARARSETG